ncbi:hypothetical protein [Pseudomonas gessardii]|uniref:hypothetical protein n=1 Tax=Pseudomonas gessardii TaxID=78544 RepID=UPI0014752A49|nr:hypothetical protein [Pseudomonas gessardii]NNA66243.1 hypothetical protein [Pseudomonas gessardii]
MTYFFYKSEAASVMAILQQAEHSPWLELWLANQSAPCSTKRVWDALGVNSGAILLDGGVSFLLDGTGYFCLGFPINRIKHLAAVMAHAPTNGWIEGAVAILPSVYEEARRLKIARPQEVPHV